MYKGIIVWCKKYGILSIGFINYGWLYYFSIREGGFY